MGAPRITPEEIIEMQRLYRKLGTYAAVAREVGRSASSVSKYVAAAGGCFGSSDYNGEPIFVDSETHIPLSESDIAEINQALSK